MATYQFSVGMHFLFRGHEYVIVDGLPDGRIRIRNTVSDETQLISEQELIEAAFKEEFEFLGDSVITRERREQVKSLVDDLSMLEDNDPRKIEALRREEYLQAIDKNDSGHLNAETLVLLIKEVHDKIKDSKKVPHWKTVKYEWWPVWIDSGKDKRSLVPNYRQQGNRTAKIVGEGTKRQVELTERNIKLAEESKQVFVDVKNELLLTGKPVSVADYYDQVRIRIRSKNGVRKSEEQLPMPHINALYYFVEHWSPYEKCQLIEGKARADYKYRSTGKGPDYKWPLQRVEFDDTTTDIIGVDLTTRLPLGRSTFTFGIDCYSDIPAGFNLGYDGGGFLPVSRAFRHAIEPKFYLKSQFPMVEGDWPVYGVPLEIGIDNGPGYVSGDLKEACNQLGSGVDYCPVRCPNAKPTVENFFDDLNDRLLHRQPGTSFSNIFAKGDYDPSVNAVISHDALLEIFHIFMVDIFARSKREGLNNTPYELWTMGTKNFKPPLPGRPGDLRILLGHIEYRTVQSSGINLHSLQYNSNELATLRKDLAGEVKLKYDATDISVIYVWDTRRDRYLKVPALDLAYTSGLSLWQHEVIKRYAREVLRVKVDKEALDRAKMKIQEIVDREWIRSGKAVTRAQMARWMGIRQPDYNSVLKITGQELLPTDRPTSISVPDLLKPGRPAFDGISNESDTPLVMEQSPAENGEGSDITHNRMDLPATDGASESYKSTGKAKSAEREKREKPANSGKVKPVPEPSLTPEEDDGLDTSDYTASYDLPKGLGNGQADD
jgi:putative transposase